MCPNTSSITVIILRSHGSLRVCVLFSEKLERYKTNVYKQCGWNVSYYPIKILFHLYCLALMLKLGPKLKYKVRDCAVNGICRLIMQRFSKSIGQKTSATTKRLNSAAIKNRANSQSVFRVGLALAYTAHQQQQPENNEK